MIAFIGVAATLGVFGCLVLAVVSKLRGGNAKIPLLWAAVCVALVAFMASFETDKSAEATEPPPDAPEAVEAQEPADSAEPAQNDTETPPEPVTEPVPTEEPEPEPAPVEETPQPEKVLQSPESIVEFLDTMYSGLGMENYTVSYDDGAFVINLWEPGLTGIANRMANSAEDIPEDLTAQYESWTKTATSLSESAHRFVTEAGRDEDVKAFILNEWNHDNVIFCAINGVVYYDLGRGITW